MKSEYLKYAAVAVVAGILAAGTAQASTSFGSNAFYSPPLKEVSDLKAMIKSEKWQIKIGLRAEGLRPVYDDLMAQIDTVEIREVDYPKGTYMEWMFFRNKGTGPLRIDEGVLWEADEPFPGFEFDIDSNGKRYTFVVPFACGNIALLKVNNIPAPAEPAPEPVAEPEPAPKPVAEPEPVTEPESTVSTVVDLGAIYQLDPATYAMARIGVEKELADNVSVLAMAGIAAKLQGHEGEHAILFDLFLNRYWSAFYAGIGVGGWMSVGDQWDKGEDRDLDLILNAGYKVLQKPDYSMSVFGEVRGAVDELNEFDDFGYFGGGLRFHF